MSNSEPPGRDTGNRGRDVIQTASTGEPMEPEMDNEHLTEEEIGAYVDGVIAPEERERLESHLAECSTCVDTTVSASGSLNSWRRKGRRRVYMPTIAAAAVIGLLAVGLSVGDDASSDPERFREPATSLQDESVQSIETVFPAEGGTLLASEPGFGWRSVEPDALYRLSLIDAAGDVVWNGSTRDTVLSLTSRVLLTPGVGYFWYVDALLEDGASATSGVRSFQAVSAP